VVVRLLGHRLSDHGIDCLGQAGLVLARVRWILLEVRPGDRQPRASGERRLAGQALVDQTAQRVDIRSAVDRLILDLLRREVRRRAQRAALAVAEARLLEPPGQSEVGKVDVVARV
jgi:hypothetical protein